MGEAKRRQGKKQPPKPYKMKVVPDGSPDLGKAMLSPQFAGPAIVGKGNFNAACGHCGTVLLQNVERDGVQHLLIRCGGCGTINEVPPNSQLH